MTGQSGTEFLVVDLFCGAGGASMGYHRALKSRRIPHRIIGVDIVAQPDYPFTFVMGDALAPPVDLESCDLVHASPPCQAFTQMSARWRGRGGRADSHPDLLAPIRGMFSEIRVPWVIENVVGARRHMGTTFTLHGGMFGLSVHRPRLFESSWWVLVPKVRRTVDPIGVYGKPDGRGVYRLRNNGSGGGKSVIRAWSSIEEGQIAMGIDWTSDERCIAEAIPPAYTEFIMGQYLDSRPGVSS